jgi:dUTP pyrophosphatase
VDQVKVYIEPEAEEAGITLPVKKTKGASGYDVKAFMPGGGATIPPGMAVTISTGLRFDIPEGKEIQMRGRSGMWFNKLMITQEGTIDSDYTGVVKLQLYNLNCGPVTINPLDRFCQAVICDLPEAEMILGEGEIKETERGDGGFGHTGVQ